MVYNTKGKVKRAQHLPVFLPPKPLMALSSQSKINDKKEDIAQFIKQIIEELYKIYESKLNKYKDASGGSNDIDAEGQASAGTGTQETSDGTDEDDMAGATSEARNPTPPSGASQRGAGATNGNPTTFDFSIKTREQFKEEISIQGFSLIPGTAEDNIITGISTSDHITGLAGNDSLNGLDGDDFINGNSGSDRISGGNNNDYLRGGSENDFVNGNSGDDYIFGDNGDDTLRGGEGNDILNGNDGNDISFGDKGRDIFLLSSGQDIISDFEIGEDSIGILSVQAFTITSLDGGVLIDLSEAGTTLLTGIRIEDFNPLNEIKNFVENA